MKHLSKQSRLAFLETQRHNGEIFKHCLEVMKENLELLSENEKFGFNLCKYFQAFLLDDRVTIEIEKYEGIDVFVIRINEYNNCESYHIYLVFNYSENGLLNKSKFKVTLDLLIDRFEKELSEIDAAIEMIDDFIKDINQIRDLVSDALNDYPRYLTIDIKDTFDTLPTYHK